MEWVASQRDWLSIDPLPGYAPDVNPIEQVWGNLKSAELANLCSDSISEVATIADDGLDRIGSDAALCFVFLTTAVYVCERHFNPVNSQNPLVEVALPVARHLAGRTRRRLLERMVLGRR